jgi:outer membrane protein assembly factor BamA
VFTNRTDDPFSPTHGYTARLDLEHASKYTLSDFRYNRISGEATRFQPIGHAVLAGHVQFGWVKPIGGGNGLDSLGQVLHPRKRFYAGGANSVRGYGENQLGPRVLTIDPKRLMDAGCSDAEIAAASCSAAVLDSIPSNAFSPVPTGGTSLIEASLEYRFPTAMKHLWGAVFVDGAYLGEGSLTDVSKGNGAITPGFGVRYESPVGPIRVDLGIRPTLKEDLSVITEVTNPDGSHSIVRLTQRKTYNPVEGGSGFKKIINRLALHLQIGQAF